MTGMNVRTSRGLGFDLEKFICSSFLIFRGYVVKTTTWGPIKYHDMPIDISNHLKSKCRYSYEKALLKN